MKKVINGVSISLLASALMVSGSVTAASDSSGATLKKVKEAGVLKCGVSTGLPGFSSTDAKGNWEGIDVEYCRAVAAAVLKDASKVQFVPLTAKERFTALQSGEIDILSRNTTWTMQRDSALGINFVGVNYYDGQGFMVSKELGIGSAKELDGASVCIQSGTTTELNLADYFRVHGMEFKPVVFDTSDQTVKGFEAGRCDVLTSDQSQLYSLRIKLADPTSAVVLPEVISKEPLGPVVAQGDDQWFNIAKWTLNVMVNAEEYGIEQANVDSMKTSTDPNVLRLLGVDGPKGQGLGLTDDWSYQVLKQVGNYSDSFERTVGTGSPLKIARGLNALWNDGGIMYAPPVR
ncbi:amino acid ABC transporter substrate-binding protein [Photobacterium sp. ZSDE20]|uniref:Amino acid ABC transporter substrate-binding protein n=2 Tax=Vibrionaceae TaxID=641 RepID=A0ABT1N079_9GAMM|nr:amino acid ABC transporter substrate-binding protein [Photobacterium sp. ZSDE20]MCQ1058069.1 amino acid ABC transporter substrate-binding protein [Photobacterium sp. ZSDE20]MDD1822602.1 amino acid ABC transporter substrate-binding protein [Photobacterium sp. ZSDE20]